MKHYVFTVTSTEFSLHIGESHGYIQVTFVDWVAGQYEHPDINFIMWK